MGSLPTGRADQRRRTQERILAAAQKLFTELGYDRATIRGIAVEAETDPGLVMRYFGSKGELFAAVAGFEPAAVVTGSPHEATEQLLSALQAKVAEPPAEALAAIRSMFTHPAAANDIRAGMVAAQRQVAEHLPDDEADLRAGLLGAVLIGTVIGRHLLQLDGLSDADPERVAALLRSAFHDIAHGPAVPAAQ
ncbi:TetR family transcriptional regulator [Nocardia sp. NPDC052254]|uniref:TetR/AcrR family transcriptional regulator n=1 Tax=Nocardia sp. NPDC052254 TaxID=3155681 RepID=UPI00342EAACF